MEERVKRKRFIIYSRGNKDALVPVGSISFPSGKYNINAENKFVFTSRNIISQPESLSSNILTVIFGSFMGYGESSIICEVSIEDVKKIASLSDDTIVKYLNNAISFGIELDIHNIMVPEWHIDLDYQKEDWYAARKEELDTYRDNAFQTACHDILNYLRELKQETASA